MRVRPVRVVVSLALMAALACSQASETPEESAERADPGRGFLPVAQAATNEQPGVPEAAPVPKASTPEPPASAPTASKPEQAARASRDPRGDGAEVSLAEVLIHRTPKEVEAYLKGPGQSLPQAQRELALAFAHALAGAAGPAQAIAADIDRDELEASELASLDSALGKGGARAVNAAVTSSTGPLARAMQMRLCERDARAELAAGAAPLACKLYSSLFDAELAAPWAADRDTLARWTQTLTQAQQQHRWSAKGPWPSSEVVVQPGDSLTAIRKRVLGQQPELLISTGLVQRANQMKSETSLQPGDKLRIPLDRASVEVYVGSRWMLYKLGDEVAGAWQIGVGMDGHDTPPGNYTVGPKQKNPMWFRPGEEPVPFGDPQNPLGTRWLPWFRDGQKTGFGFHGTNDDSAVGGRVSQGCVRMRNSDVELLFEILPEGAEVRILP